MKKTLVFALLLGMGFSVHAQHLFEHDYPLITEVDPQIRALMDSVSIDSLTKTIEHLSSYHTRRYDSRFIYEVQDWLYDRYSTLELDTVIKHDFKLHGLSITETGDNIIAIKWGSKHPEEFVVCGAHYDSYAWDGNDPDTIRSPGADDNATGVAGIWEAARILSRHTFDRSIIFASWCAEECGLVGSTAYAKECAEQNMDIVGYFNLDMTGYLKEGSDIHVHLLYTTRDSTFADYFYNFCDVYYPNLRVTQNWLINADSDFSSFNRNGYPALQPFEDVHASSPFIHSRNDILGLSVNNMEQCKLFSELNLGAVAILAGLSHQEVTETASVPVAVFPNPAKEAVTIMAEEGIQQVVLYNLLGQPITTNDRVSDKKTVLSTEGLSQGLYIIRVVTTKGVVTKELVVK